MIYQTLAYATEAGIMGVQLLAVHTPEQAAKQIEEWEKNPHEDLFSY